MSVLVPGDASLSCYSGIVCVHGHEFSICIGTAADGRPSEVECCPTLQQLLAPHQATLQARLAQSASASAFLVELEDILSNVLRAHPPRVAPAVRFFSRLLEELDALGWAQLVELDASLTSMQLRHSDEHGRQHNVPHIAIDSSIMLPHNFTFVFCFFVL